MAYFVTGATGFIGRHLVERLLERDGDVYVLVRPESIGRLDALIHRWGGAGRIRPVLGDLSKPLLGLDPEQVAELRGTIDHFFHLAAVYDMTADEAQDRLANVEGTRHAVALAERARRRLPPPRLLDRGRGRLQRRSSARTCSTRASRSTTRTTARSSRPSRSCASETAVPWRVYRPAVVVGHSQHRRDGQDRRALLLLQADPAARRRGCRRGCRWSRPSWATRTSCRSTTSPPRWTTSRTSPASTAVRSTS